MKWFYVRMFCHRQDCEAWCHSQTPYPCPSLRHCQALTCHCHLFCQGHSWPSWRLSSHVCPDAVSPCQCQSLSIVRHCQSLWFPLLEMGHDQTSAWWFCPEQCQFREVPSLWQCHRLPHRHVAEFPRGLVHWQLVLWSTLACHCHRSSSCVLCHRMTAESVSPIGHSHDKWPLFVEMHCHIQLPEIWCHCQDFPPLSFGCHCQGLDVSFVVHCQMFKSCCQLHVCWLGHCQLVNSPMVRQDHESVGLGQEHVWEPLTSVRHCQVVSVLTDDHLQVADKSEFKSQGQVVKKSQFGLMTSLSKELRLKIELQLYQTHSWTTVKVSSSQEHTPILSGKNACRHEQLRSRFEDTVGHIQARLFVWWL